ncbi:PREDICTED: cytochrome P450 9e2-like [Papilio xuthus]|uniref:unspecific monooxygenase n=2 Tax=Papilio xuthus TaxID=66420 RepID=A0AAJ7ECI8_PAPXU
MVLLVLLSAVAVALAVYLRHVYTRFSKYGVKSLTPLPILGNMARIVIRMDHFAQNMERMYKLDSRDRFVGKYQFLDPVVIIKDIDLIKAVTVRDFEHFLDHRNFVDEKLDSYFGRNLFSLKGEEWKQMRSILSPAFTSSKIRSMVPFMVEVGDKMINSLRMKIKKSGKNIIDVDCKDLTTRYANDVIATCAFGLKIDSHTEENNAFYKKGKETVAFNFMQLLKFFTLTSWPNVSKFFRITLFSEEIRFFFRDLVLNTINDREERNIFRPDMIHLLMEAKKGNLKHENGKDTDAGFATVEESAIGKKNVDYVWNDNDLVAQVLLFFIGGFDTVSTVMSFALHELAVNPEVQEKLHQEIKEHHENNGKIDFDAVNELKYLDMVISEVLRLWPPAVSMDRLCVKDYNLGKCNEKSTKDFIVRKGESIIIPAWAIHRDPAYYPSPRDMLMILLIWTAVVLSVCWLYSREVYSKFSKRGVNHLKPTPFLGNMASVILRRNHFVEATSKLYNAYSDDKFLGWYEFVNPIIMLKDIELIKTIGVKDFEYFLDHRPIVDGKIDPFFGRSLISLKGEEWKDMRSTLSPAFTSSKMRLMVPFMVEVGDIMIKSLKERIQSSEGGYIDVECKDLTNRYANDVIASCAFGLKVDSHTDRDNIFYKMGNVAATFRFVQLLKIIVTASWPMISKILRISVFDQNVKDFFQDLIQKTIQERESKSIIRPDLINLLMKVKKGQVTNDDSGDDNDAGFATVEESSVGKKNVNRAWTENDLIAQAVLFFIAGFETISSAMTFALHELAMNPDMQERLLQEIRDNDQKNGGKFDYTSIQNMKYLDMVVSEVLRKWPPAVALDRLCLNNYNLGKPNKEATKDYIIRKGEIVTIPVWSIHYDPNFYPDPEKFNPERFSDENKHQIKPFTYIPFGLGPRNCIGSRFALCEVKVLLYQVVRRMQLTPCEKTCIPAQLATDTFNIRLKGGHWLRFRLRQ